MHEADRSRVRELHDIALIRPAKRLEEVRFRRGNMDSGRLRGIKKGLRTLHTFEVLAANTYRFQMSHRTDEATRIRIAAICNELTHQQDFVVKLHEFGWRPSKLRFTFWLAGMVIGTATRILGIQAILKSGIWLETKAVSHYEELLSTIDWDDETRAVIEKNWADEMGHVERWTALLEETSLPAESGSGGLTGQ